MSSSYQVLIAYEPGRTFYGDSSVENHILANLLLENLRDGQDVVIPSNYSIGILKDGVITALPPMSPFSGMGS